MTPKKFQIHAAGNTVVMDSVTFSFKFSDARISAYHPMGPVFELGAAKVVLTESQAEQLVIAGVPDAR